MSQQETTKKKRKSYAADGQEGDVRVLVAEGSSSAGPAFVNFPSIRPAKSIPFTLYSRDTASTSDLSKQQTLIAGETEDVEFFSINRDRQAGAEGADCQYLPAIYDPDTQTLHIHPSAPLYLLAHRVKRQRATSLPIGDQRKAEYRAKRDALGEAFGTRKAKVQIRAEERNKIDVGAMQAVKGHLMEAIGEKEAVPEGPIGPSELIPIPNMDTSEIDEIYTRETLIPQAEYSAIDINPIVKAHDDRGRSGALPWRRSRHIEDKMRYIVSSGLSSSHRKTHLKMCYYLATLLGFLDLAPRLSKIPSTDLSTKLPGVPSQVINGLISRFAEPSSAGTKRYQVTEKTRTKLLTYICCVYLFLDIWSVEIGKVAADLKMPPTKVADLYKSLGCSVTVASPEEREKAGMSLQEAQKNKKAVLRAPVVFPKPKTRGPVKR